MRPDNYTLMPLPEDLAAEFLREILAVIAGVKISSAAYDVLWRGYFQILRPYVQPGDLEGGELTRPRQLQSYVDPRSLYGFFRAWLRKQGSDPDTLLQAVERKELIIYN